MHEKTGRMKFSSAKLYLESSKFHQLGKMVHYQLSHNSLSNSYMLFHPKGHLMSKLC